MTSCRKRSSGPGGTCLPQLSSGDFPVRPWPFRVARNLLTDADRAARSRPATVRTQAAEEGRDDTGLNRVLDQQIVADAPDRLSPAHRTVLVETFYRGRTLAKVARQLGIQQAARRSRALRTNWPVGPIRAMATSPCDASRATSAPFR
jgi:DNA-directed RNA polymerase specialized sigma24 family protein